VIAGRPYKVDILAEQEEIVRKAAKELNGMIKDYAHRYQFDDQQDLLAMVALQFAHTAVDLESEKDFREKEMEQKLAEIDQLLESNI
jgi:cell division protein ZapA